MDRSPMRPIATEYWFLRCQSAKPVSLRPPLTFSFILSPQHTANGSVTPGAAFSQRAAQSMRKNISPRRKLGGVDEREHRRDNKRQRVPWPPATYLSRPVVHEGGSLAGKESASVLSISSSDGFVLGDPPSCSGDSADFRPALVLARSFLCACDLFSTLCFHRLAICLTLFVEIPQ